MAVSCDIEIYYQFYPFVAPDDERNLIFGQWLNQDELTFTKSGICGL
ncbi:hypothetical protein [uncultured Nostoc sp.]